MTCLTMLSMQVSYMEGNTNTPCTPVEGAEALKIGLGCSVAKNTSILARQTHMADH